MKFDMQLIGPAALALLTALVVSFLMTPVVKSFAYKVGAIDVPKDERRMHHKPIPRLGGLAIFAGFMASILLFVDIRLNPQMQSILLGAVIIVVLGVVDDIMALPAKLKFVVQIVAALIPALNGVSIHRGPRGLPHLYPVQHQHLQQRPLLDTGLAVHPHLRVLDRGHHQRGEPDRRAGRSCQRRVGHFRRHGAGDRPDLL